MFTKNFLLAAIFLQSVLFYTGLMAMPESHEPSLSQFQTSESVTLTAGEVILYGMADGSYSWLSYPVASIPFDNFTIEVEAAAEPTEGRWPNIGIAYNGAPDSFLIEETVNSAEWQKVSLGEFTKTNDNRIYFIFTNDYWNQETGADLNLKIRKITFQGEQNIPAFNANSVKLSWDKNTEDDLAGYKVYHGNESGNYTNPDILDTEITSYWLVLAMDNTYYTAVTAYDTAGNESNYSKEIAFRLETPVGEEEPLDCDINGDGQFTTKDWFLFFRYMNSVAGDSNYMQKADFNKDGKIDEQDEMLFEVNCKAKLLPPTTNKL